MGEKMMGIAALSKLVVSLMFWVPSSIVVFLRGGWIFKGRWFWRGQWFLFSNIGGLPRGECEGLFGLDV
jgi:hypothetical protein